MATYKVIFLGLSVAGPEEEARLIAGLQKKFNLPLDRAEKLLQKIPVVVKKGISKAEMERYVKAFEEIGGKLRIEEEQTEPLPLFPESPEPMPGPGTEKPQPPFVSPPTRPEPPPVPEPPRNPELTERHELPPRTEPPVKPRPFRGNRITCPQCGFEQPETDECVKCGIVISKFVRYQEIAKSFEGQVKEIVSEEEPGPSWEGSGEGFIGSFFTTAKEALFSSTAFFRKVAKGSGTWAPLMFGVICGLIGTCMAILWQWLFATKWIPAQVLSLPFFSIFLIVLLVALPFVLAFSILLGSGITHLCLMIVGGNKKGYSSTFRALSYAYSGNLFGVIPVIGNSIGGIYTLVLTIIGVREGHRISTGRAALAVLLPLILLVGLGILAALFIPILLGMGAMKFLGGTSI